MPMANVSHGKIKMDEMVRRRELPCVCRCIESESFVVRFKCQWKKKRSRSKEEAMKRMNAKSALCSHAAAFEFSGSSQDGGATKRYLSGV
jgi:hypothetical protein